MDKKEIQILNHSSTGQVWTNQARPVFRSPLYPGPKIVKMCRDRFFRLTCTFSTRPVALCVIVESSLVSSSKVRDRAAFSITIEPSGIVSTIISSPSFLLLAVHRMQNTCVGSGFVLVSLFKQNET